MPRPCKCDLPNCHLCNLYHTNEEYRRAWDQPEPNVLNKAINLASAIVRHVATGANTVSEEVYNQRLSICAQCPQISKDGQKCTVCGCYLKIKARWAIERCPLPEPKWDRVSPELPKPACESCPDTRSAR